jgi:osmotically-inducible protein OsmY
MRTKYLLGVVVSTLLAAGCSTEQPNRAAASDRALEDHLQTELSRYGALADNEPDVRFASQDGVVTLSGTIRNEKDREMIEGMVRNTSGVVGVNDQLAVLYPPTGAYAPNSGYAQPAPVYTTAPQVAQPQVAQPPVVVVVPEGTASTAPTVRVEASTKADSPVAHQILAKLHADSVPADQLQNVTISVTGGQAYVQGSVPTQQQHNAIISSIRTVPGVRVVYDQLQVR